MSGLLGIATLKTNIREPLLPMFSGLFGIGMMLLSFKACPKLPPQIPPRVYINWRAAKMLAHAVIAGWICAFMPGLGPSQGAVLASQFSKMGNKGFLFLIGGINAANFVISFVTLYSIGKARNGAVVAISRLHSINAQELALLLAVCLFVGSLSVLLAPFLSKIFSYFIVRVNYRVLCIVVIVLVVLLVAIISGFLGLVVLFASTAIGFTTNIKGVRKSHMMGCLLLPVLVWYLK